MCPRLSFTERDQVIDMKEPEKVVQELRGELKDVPEPRANPAFVLVCGLPGAGKSYFSRRLAEQLPGIIVESDALRKRLRPSPTYSAQESQWLFSICHLLIEDLLREGITVIHDATNLIEKHRERLYRMCERLNIKPIVVWVEAPREIIIERFRDRAMGMDPLDSSDADWSVYARMKAKIEKIRRNYFLADTSRDIDPVVRKVAREAKR